MGIVSNNLITNFAIRLLQPSPLSKQTKNYFTEGQRKDERSQNGNISNAWEKMKHKKYFPDKNFIEAEKNSVIQSTHLSLSHNPPFPFSSTHHQAFYVSSNCNPPILCKEKQESLAKCAKLLTNCMILQNQLCKKIKSLISCVLR